jgi:hypothetical protein
MPAEIIGFRRVLFCFRNIAIDVKLRQIYVEVYVDIIARSYLDAVNQIGDNHLLRREVSGVVQLSP